MFEFLEIAGIVLATALLSSALLAKLLVTFARNVTAPANPMDSVETVTRQWLDRRLDGRQAKSGTLPGVIPPQPHFDSESDEPLEDESFSSAENVAIDPSLQQNLFGKDVASGFGPMASSDFGSELDIPTVIRNLSD